MIRPNLSSFIALAAAVALGAAPALAQRGGRGGGAAALPQNLTFRFMGPAVGNRILAAARCGRKI